MNLNEEYDKRRKFLEFLEANGLSPKQDKKIFEIAPDISLSISRLLVERYGKLYKTFITSPKFKYDNKYGIKGIRGEVDYFYKGLTFSVPKTKLNDENLSKKLFTKDYKLPRESDFDTVLIYGFRDKMFGFQLSKLRKIFGEVYKGSSESLSFDETERYYSHIMTYLNFKYYGEYQFIQEYDSKNDDAYILIKNK